MVSAEKSKLQKTGDNGFRLVTKDVVDGSGSTDTGNDARYQVVLMRSVDNLVEFK